MNRIENILLTLATAAALIAASTAKADPDPCPETGVKQNRTETRSGEGPNDGLIDVPVVKTRTGTRLARDLELEEANRESGMRPEDGLPGRPVVKTPGGTRTARDLEAEQARRGDGPCPDTKNNDKDRDANRSRTSSAGQAGSLLKHRTPVLPDLNGTKTKDGELVDRDQLMDSLKNVANRGGDNDAEGETGTTNTTLDRALERAGIDPSRLDGATTETHGTSTKTTLDNGTVIWTGPDGDELGTSVTFPDGSEINVSPDGRVSTRQGRDGDTVTHHPNGTTTVYDPKQDSLTIVDRHGRVMTRPLDFFDDWYAKGYPADSVLDLIDPRPGQTDPDNTTLRDAMRRAGVSADDLKNATAVEPSEHGDSIKITLRDGTVIWTGPNSDGYGTSVTRPDGDQTEVYPDGRVSTRKGQNGEVVTTHPGGYTTTYHPEDETLTVRDSRGNSETRTMEYWNDWFKQGHTAIDLLRLYHPE